jgi:hypothetical protein
MVPIFVPASSQFLFQPFPVLALSFHCSFPNCVSAFFQLLFPPTIQVLLSALVPVLVPVLVAALVTVNVSEHAHCAQFLILLLSLDCLSILIPVLVPLAKSLFP